MHQALANSTFRIQCDRSSGSGFSFRKENIIITNHHVIEPFFINGSPIFAITEEGIQLNTRLLSYSDKSQYDFAILELEGSLPANRSILQPEVAAPITRGAGILFSGFPHGIHDLLVHEAIISGYVESHAFYVDGSVNGGNSGGPILDKNTGKVVGIITQRRFLCGHKLEELGKNINHLHDQYLSMAGQVTAQIAGVNFGQLVSVIAQGLGAISQVISANANSGIGIGFKIEYVNNEFNRLNL